MSYLGKGTGAGRDQPDWDGTTWRTVKRVNSQIQSLTATGSWNGIADIIYVTGAGAKTITLPLPTATPRKVTIVDAANTAEQNPITVVAAGGGFINGQTSFLINKRGGAAIFELTSIAGNGSWQVSAQGIHYAENVVIWRPSSSVVRPNVFTTFVAALAAAKSSLGPGRIYLDDADSSTFAVAAAAHDFEGRISLHASGDQQIDFATNASFNNVPEIRCNGGQLTLDDGTNADTNNSILRIVQAGLNPVYENIVDVGSNVRRFIRVDTGEAAATVRRVTLLGSSVIARSSAVESDGALQMVYQGFGPHTITTGAFVDEASHGEDLTVDIESPVNVNSRDNVDDNWSGTVNLSYLFPGVRLAPSTITGVATLEGTHGRDLYTEVDSTGGGFTLTLPPAADCLEGDLITIKDVGGDASSNNVTVDGNSANIDGAGTLTMNTNFQSVTLRKNSGGTWSVI